MEALYSLFTFICIKIESKLNPPHTFFVSNEKTLNFFLISYQNEEHFVIRNINVNTSDFFLFVVSYLHDNDDDGNSEQVVFIFQL